jgi:hypothetical protein
MRATIVVDDNIVLVDGKARTVDCSPLIKDGTHAVQWYDLFGEVEFRTEFDGDAKVMTRKPNETITDFSPYETYVEEWRIENAKQELVEAAQKKAMEDQVINAERGRVEIERKLAEWLEQQRLLSPPQ